MVAPERNTDDAKKILADRDMVVWDTLR